MRAFDTLFMFYVYFNVKPCANFELLLEFCKHLASLSNKSKVASSVLYKLQKALEQELPATEAVSS